MIDKSYLFLTFIVLSFLIIAEDEKNALIEVYSKGTKENSINIVLKDNIDFRNKRPAYLENFLNRLVNWENVASRM